MTTNMKTDEIRFLNRKPLTSDGAYWREKYFDLMEENIILKDQYGAQQALLEAYQKQWQYIINV